MSKKVAKKAGKGASAPSPYVAAPEGPQATVVSVKIPNDVIAEVDRLVRERQHDDPLAARSAIVRELVIKGLRAMAGGKA